MTSAEYTHGFKLSFHNSLERNFEDQLLCLGFYVDRTRTLISADYAVRRDEPVEIFSQKIPDLSKIKNSKYYDPAKIIVAELIPGKVSIPMDIYKVATGKELFTGKQLTTEERVTQGILVAGDIGLEFAKSHPAIRIGARAALMGAKLGYDIYKQKKTSS